MFFFTKFVPLLFVFRKIHAKCQTFIVDYELGKNIANFGNLVECSQNAGVESYHEAQPNITVQPFAKIPPILSE